MSRPGFDFRGRPLPPTTYLTVDGGTVHRADCPIAQRAQAWPWQARNDGPGVARACARCLPDGLPGEAS